jgi:PST family polysaccharide transporter
MEGCLVDVELGKKARPVGVRTSATFQIILGLGTIQVLTMAFSLLRSKIAAVTVGPAGIGAMSLVDQVGSLAGQVSSFSLPFAAVKFLSEAHSESSDAFARLYGAFLRVLLLVSVAGAAIAIALLFRFPEMLGRELGGYTGIVVMVLLALPATNLMVFLTNVLASCQRIRAAAFYGLASAVLLATFCSAGVVIGGLRGYYLANLLVMVFLVIGAIAYLKRREQLSPTRRGFPLLTELRRYRNVLSFSAALYITAFTSPFSELMARYAVLRVGGLENTGLFQAAIGLSLALRTVVRSSFSLFLTPSLNRKMQDSEKLYQAGNFLRVLSLALVIMALPIALAPDLWLSTLYSQKFTAVSGTVYVFVVAISLQLIAAVNVALLIGVNDIAGYLLASVAGDIATGTFSWLWVPHFGIRGVALALIVNAFLVFGLSAWRLSYRHRMAIHRVVGWFPLAMVTIVGVAGALSSWFHTNSLGVLGVKAIFWIILSSFLIVVTRNREMIPSNVLWTEE